MILAVRRTEDGGNSYVDIYDTTTPFSVPLLTLEVVSATDLMRQLLDILHPSVPHQRTQPKLEAIADDTGD